MTSTAPRRIDRQRRQRIIDATLEVITEHGMSGLSHRRVAKAAGVPLSATSYYFGTLDDLVEAAFTASIDRDRALMRARLEQVPLAENPIAAIAGIVRDQIADRAAGVRSMELFVAALRSERLRPLAQAWDDAFHEPLIPYFGDVKARVAVALMESVVQRGLVVEPPMSVEEITAVLQAGLEPG